jgi:hypothetical protein
MLWQIGWKYWFVVWLVPDSTAGAGYHDWRLLWFYSFILGKYCKSILKRMRFQVLIAVKIQCIVFWVVAL